jgi:hypothetical protein
VASVQRTRALVARGELVVSVPLPEEARLHGNKTLRFMHSEVVSSEGVRRDQLPDKLQEILEALDHNRIFEGIPRIVNPQGELKLICPAARIGETDEIGAYAHDTLLTLGFPPIEGSDEHA